MKGFLIVMGLAMLGTGVYFAWQHEHGYPAKRKRKKGGGCGCGGANGSTAGNGSTTGGNGNGGAAGAGMSDQAAGAAALAQGADMMTGGTPTGPGGAGGNFSQQLAVNAAVADGAAPMSGPAGAGATDEVQPGGGVVVANANAAAAASTFGSPQDWAGNTVPDVQANFVMANQMGAGGGYGGNAQGMVEHYNASREGTRVSPPITTITIPGGSAMAQEMNWDKTELLVRS